MKSTVLVTMELIIRYSCSYIFQNMSGSYATPSCSLSASAKPFRLVRICFRRWFTAGVAFHWVKIVLIWSYSGPHFSTFGLNTERYSVSLRIQSEFWKIRTRITPNTDTVYAVFLFVCWILWVSFFPKNLYNIILQNLFPVL